MEPGGILIAHFLQHHAAPDLGLGQLDQLRFFDLAGAVGIGAPCGS